MNENEKRKLFTQTADAFIDVANSQCETQDKAIVASAFLYGAARFCSFVVAAEAGTLSKYEADREGGMEYFSDEFKRMLGEHMEDYKRTFTES